MGDSQAYKTTLLNKATISYDYLHTNSTTHEWVFGAIAELVDNSFDAGSRSLNIDYDEKSASLSFLDDGCGMTRDEVISIIAFGHSEKKSDPNTVGQYGNGLKSGSMRIGKDFILFTKKNDIETCLFLSRTFHEENNLREVFVPTPSFTQEHGAFVEDAADRERHNIEMDIIHKYSPFADECAFQAQFKKIKGKTGTLIVCFNLRHLGMDVLELDFRSDIYDVRLSQNADQREQERNSLRAYLSILYAKPRMKVYLRGKKVATTNLVQTLGQPRMYRYMAKNLTACAKKAYSDAQKMVKLMEDRLICARSDLTSYSSDKHGKLNDRNIRVKMNLLRAKVDDIKEELNRCRAREQDAAKAKSSPRPLTFYFGLNIHHRNRYGLMVYNNGRLIEMYLKLSIQRERHDQHMKCLGVIGIVDVPCTVLAPTHNKQGFENRTEYLALIRAANEHMEQYWNDVKLNNVSEGAQIFWKQFGYKSTTWESVCSTEPAFIMARHKTTGYTVQCDNCLKWRHLSVQKRYIEHGIPDDWTCGLNPNAAFQSCNKAEDLPKIREGKLALRDPPKEKIKQDDDSDDSKSDIASNQKASSRNSDFVKSSTKTPSFVKASAKSTPPTRETPIRSAALKKRSRKVSEDDEDDDESEEEEEESDNDKQLRSNARSRIAPAPMPTSSRRAAVLANQRMAKAPSPPTRRTRSPVASRRSAPSPRKPQRKSRAKESEDEESEEEEEEEEDDDFRNPPPSKISRVSANGTNKASFSKSEVTMERARGDSAISLLRSIIASLSEALEGPTLRRVADLSEEKLLSTNIADEIKKHFEYKLKKEIDAADAKHTEELSAAKKDARHDLMNPSNEATMKLREAAFVVLRWATQDDQQGDYSDLCLENSLASLIEFASTLRDSSDLSFNSGNSVFPTSDAGL